MQAQLAEVVHALIDRAPDLRYRLRQGAVRDLDAEQALLKDMLLPASDGRRYSEFGPDWDRPRGSLSPQVDRQQPSGYSDGFLGARYALVCWLDELFTRDDSDWATRWNEQKLEIELYGSNDRAWKFWQQAQLAQSRTCSDALEVGYLCVMLGFRGDLRNHDKERRTWVANARHRLGEIQQMESPSSPALDAPLLARPLRGRHKLGRMVMTSWVVLLALVPVTAFVLVWRLGQ